jgi:predicted ATPase
LLAALPDGPERIEQELALQMTLAVPLLTTKGYAAPEVEGTYARARELCLRAGETARLFPALSGLWNFNLARGDLRSAQELSKQLFALAERARDPSPLIEGHLARGTTLFFVGDFAPALDHVEQGIQLYDPHVHRSHAFVYGQDPGVYSTLTLAWALWLSGYPDRALARSADALELARDLAHPFSLVLALHCNAVVHQFRREPQLAGSREDAVIALAAERGFSYWLSWALIIRGWAVAQQEQGAEGIAQIREGLEAVRGGAELALPWGLVLLAEALGSKSLVEEALNVLAEALAVSNRNGDLVYEAEIYRLKGELLLASTENRTEADSCFRCAIEIARRQQAKSWELRAVTSLSRLLQEQGEKDKHAECWQRSTAGSRRASTRRI